MTTYSDVTASWALYTAKADKHPPQPAGRAAFQTEVNAAKAATDSGKPTADLTDLKKRIDAGTAALPA